MVALAALATACAARIDPLDIDRQRLAALAETAVDEGWRPHATLVVPDAVLGRALTGVVATLAGDLEPVELSVGLGLGLRVAPQVQAPTVEVSASDACGSDAALSPTGVLLADDLGWRAEASVELEVAVHRSGDERTVRLQRAPEREVAVRVALDAIAEPYGSAATSWLAPDLSSPLVALTPEVRDVRVRGDAGLVVELALNVLESAPAERPDTSEEWALQVPAETLLGLARAIALRVPPEEGFLVEPAEVQLFGGRFAVRLRVWKVGRRWTWREYLVQGDITLTPGQRVAFAPDDAGETDQEGWGGSIIGPLVKRRVLKMLERSADMTVPAVADSSTQGGVVTVLATRVEAEDDVLSVYGKLGVRTPE